MSVNEILCNALGNMRDWEWVGGNNPHSIGRWERSTNNAEKPTLKGNCVCGHAIKENCWIRSKKTGEIKTLGNCCVRRFMPEKEDRMLKCERCGEPHMNRKTTLCNSCATGFCCYGYKFSLTTGCFNCNKILCSSCNRVHVANYRCKYTVVLDNVEHTWSATNDSGKNYTLKLDDVDYETLQSKNGSFGFIVDGVYYWTSYTILNEIVLRNITQSIVNGDLTKYKKWIPKQW